MLHSPALVLLLRAVLDVRFSIAARAAAPELRVELLQGSRADLRDRHVTKCGDDVPLSEPSVVDQGALFNVMYVKPGVQRVLERGLGCGAALAIYLRKES